MNDPRAIDGVLVQWGNRLFYDSNRRVSAGQGGPRSGDVLRERAAAIRLRIEATAVRRAPQVMVKVTGGGRGMAAIAVHLRYISKGGRLPMEDDRGLQREGKESVQDVADQWRYGGSRIPERSDRREAFNIMLSMPRGTDPLTVQRAAREFAKSGTRGSPLRHGLARPSGQPACASERAGRVDSRQALEPAQGRPATLARDFRRALALLGHRRRSDPTGDARRAAQPPGSVADQSRVGRTIA